jgi:hypothetical protein
MDLGVNPDFQDDWRCLDGLPEAGDRREKVAITASSGVRQVLVTGSCEHDARISHLEARSREPLRSVRNKSVTPSARRIIRMGDVGVERPASSGSIARPSSGDHPMQTGGFGSDHKDEEPTIARRQILIVVKDLRCRLDCRQPVQHLRAKGNHPPFCPRTASDGER